MPACDMHMHMEKKLERHMHMEIFLRNMHMHTQSKCRFHIIQLLLCSSNNLCQPIIPTHYDTNNVNLTINCNVNYQIQPNR